MNLEPLPSTGDLWDRQPLPQLPSLVRFIEEIGGDLQV